jgi:hypothetical protein
MGNSTIHDLLPIPQGTRQPHAYQVLGLDPGEQDSSTIKAAISATVERLKQAKATTDSKTWSRAAKLVQQADVILSDSDKKSELDARFGIVPVGNRPPSPPKPPASIIDPLAAMLPASDPLAAALPPTSQTSQTRQTSQTNRTSQTDPIAPVATENPAAVLPPPSAATEMPPAATAIELPPAHPGAIFGNLAGDSGNRGELSTTSEMISPVVLKDASPRSVRRRRKSWLGSLLLALFSLTLIGLIGLLGYFLVFGPGQLAISKSNRGLTITTGPLPADRGLAINPPADSSQDPAEDATADQRPRRDNVMGRLAGDMPPPPTPAPRELPEKMSLSDAFPDAPPSDTMPSDTMRVDSDPPPSSSDLVTTAQPPAMTVPPGEMTDEMIAAADEKLSEVANLLRTAKWKEMKPAAEQLTQQPLSPSQRERAEALYELADLTSFYRGGIERGVESLVVGNDFAVTDAFRVITVETGENLLVIRFNAKNRSYTFDEFPLVLAHKLASFSMPAEAPTTRAAKAVYQALAPKSTDTHRQEAIEWLQAIDEGVEDTDPKRMVVTLKSLFSDPG